MLHFAILKEKTHVAKIWSLLRLFRILTFGLSGTSTNLIESRNGRKHLIGCAIHQIHLHQEHHSIHSIASCSFSVSKNSSQHPVHVCKVI